MQASLLNWFAQPAPTCPATATAVEVAALLDPYSLTQPTRLLVALDEQNRPLGQVDAVALLLQTHSGSSAHPVTVRTCLRPLPVVSHDRSLAEFWSLWQTSPEPFWALVDEQGTFVGLLDGFRLLHTWCLGWGERPDATVQSVETVQTPALDSLTHLVECLPLPVMLSTSGGELLKANRLWQEQLGELQPELATASSSQEQATCILLSVPGQESTVPVYQCRSADGNEHTWQLIQAPLLGGSLRLILAQDITEQHQVARELEARNADLVQLNRVKDDFLSCISHELKTPLTSILGMAGMLVEETVGPLNERQKRYATLIHQSGRHLVAVINDILDLAKVETGQLELLPEAIDLAGVCQLSLEQTRRLFQHRSSSQDPSSNVGIQFSLSIDPDLEQLVGDEFRLRQMLVNLLSNAFKFTSPPGQVSLSVCRWQSWIAFIVSDTGIGIPAEKQHLIFQKFQQLESPLTRQFEGTGMGLVLTQRLARLHGGDVTFVSQEGKGSQFTLLLPPNPPLDLTSPMPGATRRTEAINPLKGPNALGSDLVLIVEAVPTDLNILSELLSPLGYQVAVARSGLEALEKARRLKPGLIFLSPFLGSLSGWDVLSLFKQQVETRGIAVVVTASQAERRQALAAGADGFLSRPIQSRDLQRLLLDLETRAQSQAIPEGITVLRLGSTDSLHRAEANRLPGLAELLHCCGYRLLEADGLEQGELLARIWKPDVVLLDIPEGDLVTALRTLSQMTVLASLPLVCLPPANSLDLPFHSSTADLNLRILPLELAGQVPSATTVLQVLQSMVGQTTRPLLLLGDFSEPKTKGQTARGQNADFETGALPRRSTLLARYLRAAGYRVLLTQNPNDVRRQIESGNGDLLLLLLRYQEPEQLPGGLELIHCLNSRLQGSLPLVVLDDRQRHQSVFNCVLFESGGQVLDKPVRYEQAALTPDPLPDPLYEALQSAQALCLPNSVSMAELMHAIRSCLSQQQGTGLTVTLGWPQHEQN
ncbi:ATP-binding protein [Leptolyngbya sp. FACHB-261]|uniref:ATP-binding protein n=1 Tax=Leptolyngbya sp. FACHB-261 TaxID=2692806 RepID=UPI0016838C03|nr:ATP-binding protein [Leptolyngbya sp. FACHB-261]MBD2104853.1 response regulator [Leptolyngbya sp. FACHB-261]